jgi:hypothetical protein
MISVQREFISLLQWYVVPLTAVELVYTRVEHCGLCGHVLGCQAVDLNVMVGYWYLRDS